MSYQQEIIGGYFWL